MSVALKTTARESTSSATRINFNRIRSEKTIQYLEKNQLKDEWDLSKILPVCYLEGVTRNFHHHFKTYDLPHAVDKVWDAYVNVPPSIAWGGRRIGFSFSYNPASRLFFYENDAPYKGLKEDQLIFIVIRIFFGLIKIAVTHQVNIIDSDKKLIKLCYVEGGKSAGSQILRFEKTGENSTRVIHETFYKSESDFRDRKIYPFLHERIINQLHRNIKKHLKKS
jgi:hypothetical protein